MTSGRLPGLDLLRGVGALLVIVLHAGVPYITRPMPGLTWPVSNNPSSPIVDAIFWPIAATIMPLFLTMSGYLSCLSLQGRGLSRFWSNRRQRLLWPFLGSAVVVLPLEIYVWVLGWVGDGRVEWRRARSLKLGELHANLWGTSHLWYLEYVLLYSALLAGVWWIMRRQESRSAPSRHDVLAFPTAHSPSRSRIATVAFCGAGLIATAFVLWLQPRVLLGFQHGFLPIPSKFAFCGLFFAAGAARALLPGGSTPGSLPWTLLACGGGAWAIIGPHHDRFWGQSLADTGPFTERLQLVLGLSTASWCTTLGLFELAVQRTSDISPRLTWLAQSSFWVYLVHHPLVALWQIALRDTNWPAEGRFAACALGTTVLSLAMYATLVRGKAIGVFLDGPARPALSLAPAQPPGQVENVRPAAA